MSDSRAAHTPNTTWFAIDRDGRVGRFFSGEPGVIPERAARDDPDDISGHLLARLRNGAKCSTVVEELEALTAHEAPHAFFERPRKSRALVFATSPVQPAADARAIESIPDGAFVIEAIRARAVVADLHRRGACAGCFVFERRSEDPTSAEDGEDFEWAAAGVYEYTHDGEHWVGDPYARYVRPGTPLKVDELPQAVAEKISAVRFPIAFSETPRFQPMEYVACTTWQAAWETLEGELRAVAGRESEFEKDYPDHARHARDREASTYRTAATSRRPRTDRAREAKRGLLVTFAMVAVAIAIVRWLMR